ncbi:hypothetical protein FRC11_012877 [Ceratobasidium sp. 423]|nr:hypothetical protein FRC11_012877 [Ceratobasidium sp. 423]
MPKAKKFSPHCPTIPSRTKPTGMADEFRAFLHEVAEEKRLVLESRHYHLKLEYSYAKLEHNHSRLKRNYMAFALEKSKSLINANDAREIALFFEERGNFEAFMMAVYELQLANANFHKSPKTEGVFDLKDKLVIAKQIYELVKEGKLLKQMADAAPAFAWDQKIEEIVDLMGEVSSLVYAVYSLHLL